MASEKISELTENTDPQLTDLIALVDDPSGTPATKKITLGTLATLMAKDSLSRQAIINGNFVVNQRVYVSNATLAAGAYGHDRWKAGAGGGDYTFTQLPSSTQITIKAGKSLIQVIEDKNVIGGTYTLSWEGTAQARFGIDSATPSGDYAASPITITATTFATLKNNPDVSSYSEAWDARTTLTYGTYAEAF